MAYCRERLKIALGGELICDLDENHETVFPDHFDKLNMAYWRRAQTDPKPVLYTPTGPLPKLREQLPV